MAASTRPQKTAMLLAQKIVSDINRRGNEVGDRLPPERIMLEQYEVGRGTLRESLRFLELQGVISLRPGPGGGPVVERPDASGLATSLSLLLQFAKAPYSSVAEARAGLEPIMARLAAERMTDEQIEDLHDSVDTMYNNLDDQRIFLEENKRFHDLIAHGSGNEMFSYLIDALLDILDGSAMGIEYPQGGGRKVVHKAHRRIYEAIAARDVETSAAEMADHIKQYSFYVEKHFPEVLASPISWVE